MKDLCRTVDFPRAGRPTGGEEADGARRERRVAARENGEHRHACDLRQRRCRRRGGRHRTGELEDRNPGSGEVSDLRGIAPAVDDPRLPVDDPHKHALVFGDPGLDEPRHGRLTAHDLRAIADRASGLDATGHGASATSLSSSSTTQCPPTTPYTTAARPLIVVPASLPPPQAYPWLSRSFARLPPPWDPWPPQPL
uniref:Uncharacterized protein n=1 Tax=Oryza meridionalis TaxID=40149 RepID=A0A0E0CKZ0_9ORYZ